LFALLYCDEAGRRDIFMGTQNVDVYHYGGRAAPHHRAMFIAQFEACGVDAHWSLSRFEAPTRDAGCGFGALACLQQSLRSDHHAFIVDDGIDFCAATPEFSDTAIRTLPEDGWDILLTDTIFPRAHNFPSVMMLWHELQQLGQVRLLDLFDANILFRGGSMIVNRRSKGKVLAFMQASGNGPAWEEDLPQHVHAGRIKACLIMPLLTVRGVRGNDADDAATDRAGLERSLCHAFARMMWIGACQGGETAPYYSEWSRKAYRDLVHDDVVRMSAVMTPLLSIQLNQRWHLKAAEIRSAKAR